MKSSGKTSVKQFFNVTCLFLSLVSAQGGERRWVWRMKVLTVIHTTAFITSEHGHVCHVDCLSHIWSFNNTVNTEMLMLKLKMYFRLLVLQYVLLIWTDRVTVIFRKNNPCLRSLHLTSDEHHFKKVSCLLLPWSPWCHCRCLQEGPCSPHSSVPQWLSRWPAPGHSAFCETRRLCWSAPTHNLGASGKSLEGIQCEMSEFVPSSTLITFYHLYFFNHDYSLGFYCYVT